MLTAVLHRSLSFPLPEDLSEFVQMSTAAERDVQTVVPGIAHQCFPEPAVDCKPPRPARTAVGAVGPAVLDTAVRPTHPHASTAKRECTMKDSYGGGAVNVSRSIQQYGGTPQPDFLVGADAYGKLMKEDLSEEFPHSLCVSAYPQSRRSHIHTDGTTDTTRPPLMLSRLPDNCRKRAAETPVTVVAALAPDDHDFTAEALSQARFGIWVPSASQLGETRSATRLLRLAHVTVMNDEEARVSTGKDDPIEAIVVLSERGCRGVIVTSRGGALARIDGDWLFAPAHQVQAKRTSRAGDTFTGVFALAIASGRTLREGLVLGQAAAARHVTEQPPLGGLDELAAWAGTQPKVALPRPPVDLPRVITMAFAATASILAAVAYW